MELGLATPNRDVNATTYLYTHSQHPALTHTLVNLTYMFLDCGRKPEACRYESLRPPPLQRDGLCCELFTLSVHPVNVAKGHVTAAGAPQPPPLLCLRFPRHSQRS